MKPSFSVEETVNKRHSVRTYDGSSLTEEEKKQLTAYITSLSNPFSIDISFQILDKSSSNKGEKLGTYGVIKGVTNYIGASVPDVNLSLEALGYSFENLILYATSLGLGTCWLGGTFNRSGFSNTMNLKDGHLFPAISPIGHGSEKKRAVDSLMKWAAKSNHRYDWNQVFFDKDFKKPLTREEAGNYAYPLEMLRLAPSAVNKQPWRIVKRGNVFDFYEQKSLKEKTLGFDLQRVDMGIATCHFHLAAMEKNLSGKFETLEEPALNNTQERKYLYSWVADQIS